MVLLTILKLANIFVFGLFFMDVVKLIITMQPLLKLKQILPTKLLLIDLLAMVSLNVILFSYFVTGMTTGFLVDDLKLLMLLVLVAGLNGLVSVNLNLNLRILKMDLDEEVSELINEVLYR